MKLWPNPANFSGSQPVSSSSTPPAGANSFQVVTEVALDRGWAAFQGVTLTGWSETIPVTAGSQYAFSLTIAGELQATAGQGGRVRVQYDSGSSTLLWQNPANFSSGGLSHSQTFSPPAGANEMRFGYEVTLDKGWLAFSNASLERRQVAYTMTRKTYFLGSQVIATRVSGDPDGNNGLFYIHTDHLGSTSLMSDAEGYKVETSVARYLPYGGWRTEPTAALTDRAFTGQKENMDIGLYYYNARYYAPGAGRFISADTIVPDPTNPQQFNRYTYVLNNPLRYTDPTGRYCYDPSAGADLMGTCRHDDGTTYSLWPSAQEALDQYCVAPGSLACSGPGIGYILIDLYFLKTLFLHENVQTEAVSIQIEHFDANRGGF